MLIYLHLLSLLKLSSFLFPVFFCPIAKVLAILLIIHILRNLRFATLIVISLIH